MEITISKAIELQVFVSQMKQHKSLFGIACLKMDKQLTELLLPFKDLMFEKQIEFALKDKNTGAVLEKENGIGFHYNDKGKLAFRKWYSESLLSKIDVEPVIAKDIKPIAENIEVIELCNGLLCEVDLEKYVQIVESE